MVSTPIKFTANLTAIHGEPAIPLDNMPAAWQRIAAHGTWMTEPQMYTAMAQVFLAKHQYGHVLFLERPDTQSLKRAYCEGNGRLAWEAVAHFGEAFLPEAYPDFAQIRQDIAKPNRDSNALAEVQSQAGVAGGADDRLSLVDIVSDLFDELSYDVPATFYWTFLHPLQRSNLFEVRSFRFSEQDLDVARKFDAILHGGYVSMLRRLIDSVSSRYGYFLEHGCGCENHLVKLKPCDSAFHYSLPVEARSKTLRAFFWSIMEEYLLFELRSATRLVYSDNLTV
jgi:hypothetical protein